MAEASNERLSRLLVLVPWLTAHSGVSKQEAASHFGISQKQLEADLELITFTGPGVYGGELVDIYFDDDTVTVYDSQGLTEPLQLTSEEVAALLVGLQALHQLPDLDQTLIAVVAEKLMALGGSNSAVEVVMQSHEHSKTIASAMAENRDLRLQYVHPVRDDETDRTVTPLGIATRDGVDYLTAWCHTAGAVRTFRLDRMRSCTLSKPSVSIPPVPLDPHQPASATVAVDAKDRHLLESVHAEWQGDVAQVPYADEAWFVQWVVAATGRIRCLSPVHLAERVRATADSGRMAYAALTRSAH